MPTRFSLRSILHPHPKIADAWIMIAFQPKGMHAAMTNTQRQREFRRRNPGYYQRLHAQRRAGVLAYREKHRAIAAVMQEIPQVLMLPAPGQSSVIPMPVLIPHRERELVALQVR
jgi:hypothetical protein